MCVGWVLVSEDDKETIKVKKVSKKFAYIKKKLYLCSRFVQKAVSHQPSAIRKN